MTQTWYKGTVVEINFSAYLAYCGLIWNRILTPIVLYSSYRVVHSSLLTAHSNKRLRSRTPPNHSIPVSLWPLHHHYLVQKLQLSLTSNSQRQISCKLRIHRYDFVFASLFHEISLCCSSSLHATRPALIRPPELRLLATFQLPLRFQFGNKDLRRWEHSDPVTLDKYFE